MSAHKPFGFYVHRICRLDKLKGQATTTRPITIVGLQHLLPVELVLVSEVLHIVEHLVVDIAVTVKAPNGEVREGQGQRVGRPAVMFHLVTVHIPVQKLGEEKDLAKQIL